MKCNFIEKIKSLWYGNPKKDLKMSVNSINIYSDDIITQITHTLLTDYRVFEGYTKVVKLAQALGVNILLTTFKDEHVAGMLKFENNEVNLYVNENQSANRQRFTIAHELGHYILHRDFVQSHKVSVFYRKDFDNYFDRIEEQANKFAATLLMPERAVKGLWDIYHSIDVLATILKVSKQAMYVRLVKLGVI